MAITFTFLHLSFCVCLFSLLSFVLCALVLGWHHCKRLSFSWSTPQNASLEFERNSFNVRGREVYYIFVLKAAVFIQSFSLGEVSGTTSSSIEYCTRCCGRIERRSAAFILCPYRRRPFRSMNIVPVCHAGVCVITIYGDFSGFFFDLRFARFWVVSRKFPWMWSSIFRHSHSARSSWVYFCLIFDTPPAGVHNLCVQHLTVLLLSPFWRLNWVELPIYAWTS